MAEEDAVLFILNWDHPVEGASDVVLCEYCGETWYSSAENIQAALDRKMCPVCPYCATQLIAKHDTLIGGTIRHGRVIEREAKGNR